MSKGRPSVKNAKNISISLSAEAHAYLINISKDHGVSKSEVLDKLVKEKWNYLINNNKFDEQELEFIDDKLKKEEFFNN